MYIRIKDTNSLTHDHVESAFAVIKGYSKPRDEEWPSKRRQVPGSFHPLTIATKNSKLLSPDGVYLDRKPEDIRKHERMSPELVESVRTPRMVGVLPSQV